MDSDKYKRFTTQARSGIRGEAFFELLISDYALPHRIVGSKDIGVDYICEWVYGDKPTGILFIAQVKTFMARNTKPKFIGINREYNGLEQYQIRNSKLRVDSRTLQYWKGLGVPAYLFVIIQKKDGEEIDCFYRRYTHPLTASSADPSGEYYEGYYKVNRGAAFLAFKDFNSKMQGFARDLFIDLMRCSYSKGSISYISPRTIGLEQFPEEDAVFGALFEDYRESICITYNKTKTILEHLGVDCHGGSSSSEPLVVGSAGPPDEDDID